MIAEPFAYWLFVQRAITARPSTVEVSTVNVLGTDGTVNQAAVREADAGPVPAPFAALTVIEYTVPALSFPLASGDAPASRHVLIGSIEVQVIVVPPITAETV
jgi:hypothetical protein